MLRAGGVIVYPTETAYGLGADFFNLKAVKKIYQIKGRDYRKPLSVIAGDLKMAKSLVNFDKTSLGLARKCWPGPLTLVLSQKSQPEAGRPLAEKFKINDYKTLGLRISSNKLATAIVKKLGRPITATSANISGKGECYSISDVIKQFKNKKSRPDLIIDAGRVPKTKVSTVVKVIDGEIKILRRGKILPRL